jgi:hypothetical protein
MESVRKRLAEATNREVENLAEDGLHKFRLGSAGQLPHWLLIDRTLAEDEGETGILRRLGDALPHLTTDGQSLRVTLTKNRVIAEPAGD